MGIIDKAKKLGLDIGDGTESLDNLRAIASQVGFSDFESLDDASKLDGILSNQMGNASTNNIENLDGDVLENSPSGTKLGEKQYNEALDKNGRFDKNYYDNKQKSLDQKVKDLDDERHKDWKMKKGETGPVKADGSNVVKKNKLEQIKDNINYGKGKVAQKKNKIDRGLANVRRGLNAIEDPLGTAKSALEDKAKDTVNKAVDEKIKKPVKEASKKVAKNTGKAAVKFSTKVISFIAANPWVLAVIGVYILILVVIVAVMGVAGGSSSNRFGLYGYEYYEVKNLCSTVKVYNPNTDEYTRELDFETEYIPGVVKAEVGGFDSLEVLKLFSVAARTFAISRLDETCTIEGSARVQAFTYDETALAAATSEGSLIKQAIDETYGLVAVRDGSLLTTYYDAGCYRGEEGDYYLIGYGSLTLGEERTQKIPKSWAEGTGLMTYINASITHNKYCYNNHGYGISQYGSYYLATEENYTMEELIEFYTGDTQLYSIYQGVSTNYTLATSSGLTDVLTIPLRDYLSSKGTTVEAYNEYILGNVVKAGVGTRDGAVTAAVSLVGTLYTNFGARLPYALSGQHSSTDMYHNGVNVNKNATTFYGVDPDWGSSISNSSSGVYQYYYNGSYKTYTNYGPDCSGFIGWILHNAGFSDSVKGANTYKNYGTLYKVNSGTIGQAGDLMWHDGHIMFIVGVDEDKRVYYIAHASGGSQGVKINGVAFSDTTNYIVDMTEWYENHKSEITDDDFKTKYRNGYLDGYTGSYDGSEINGEIEMERE